MHPFLLTLIHLAIVCGGLMTGLFVTAMVASQSSAQVIGQTLWIFAAVTTIGLIGLAASMYRRTAHVPGGQRILWLVGFAVGAAALALVFGVTTLIVANR
jgi:uncharacterized membrane protein